MTQKEADLFIEKLQLLGSVPGLHSISVLCEKLGNPQDKLSFVHIAGTNGKGSVLAYLSETCKAAGYKVGRYSSPTISDYRERFQINGRMISKKDLCSYLERIKEACELIVAEGENHPTAFEVETALAFLYFKEKECDIVILECGMGGELDATNIIKTAKVAVLTSISKDHTAFLGNTIEEIAAHKAGIIKRRMLALEERVETEEKQSNVSSQMSVVVYPSEMAVCRVIEERCKEQGIPKENLMFTDATLLKNIKYGIKKQVFRYKQWDKMEISLLGKHQVLNAAVALDAVDALKRQGYSIPEKAVRKAFSQVTWQGRMEIVATKPMFVLDGAHNKDGAKKLAESIETYFKDKKLIYIMGMFRDKEYEEIIALTHDYAKQIITVKPPNQPRAMEAYELAMEISKVHKQVTVADSLEEAVEMSRLLADKDTVILVFGSLSYLGAIKKIIVDKK